ncbi:hypothetical protein WICMUC_000407 [Wickerhamomyces mucosus]|uniref:Transcription factor IIIC subunit 5 HTH domain-containing protein n=1 Tax=Wickerhamomyces mucosus TaxID=1378264 RepID=A0A9P8PZE6_9ASCO|nr:hypothetical protein WICMUC_000407 [Wickerhamomyces mucosus]
MNSKYAKENSLDIPHYSSIEFPLKVKNLDKALDLVGGENSILRSCQDHSVNPLELRFTSNRYEHPIQADVSTSEQILIKISLPVKELEENNGNIRKTLRCLHKQGHKPAYIQPVAIINKSFRFRELSDFQFQTKNNEIVQRFEKSAHQLKYSNLKQSLKFEQDLEPYKPSKDGSYQLPPPPRFSSIRFPFDYGYKKNNATMEKEGKLIVRNKHIKLHSMIIKYDDKIPQGPSSELVTQLDIFKKESNENSIFKDILKTIDILNNLFSTKPIWIRKHLEAILPNHLKPSLKHALPQVSYTFTKGPWRQAYIKFGIDPKSSNEFAKYQTGSFRVNDYRKSLVTKNYITDRPNDVASIFLFNGEELPATLLFQIENLIDPLIAKMIKESTYQEQADFDDGWFDKLTMAKIRYIVPYKLKSLVNGDIVDDDKLKDQLLRLEAHVHDRQEIEADDDHILNDDDDDDDDDDEYDDDDINSIGTLDIDEINIDPENSSFDEVFRYLQTTNPQGANELKDLVGMIKQKDIDFN